MIACVQMKLNPEDYKTEQAFAARIMAVMKRVREQAGEGPLLVAFPEHIGTFCLLSNAPERIWSKQTFAQASAALLWHHGAAVAHQMLRHRVSAVRALFLARAKELERIYLTPFIAAARITRLDRGWLCRTALGSDQSDLQYIAVITPTGQVVYRQHKVNLVEMEQKAGLDLIPLNYVVPCRAP